MKLQELNETSTLSKQQIINWLFKHELKNYSININLSVDVNGGVDLYKKGLTHIPVQFNQISGSFYCGHSTLTTLKGAPQYVDKDFVCSGNKLTTLEGAPQFVGRDFVCSGNKLPSLKGAPQYVGGKFDCNSNYLTSLQGCPQSVSRGFFCNSNNLTSLKGAPQSVGGDFYCGYNKLTSLHNIHKQIRSIGGVMWIPSSVKSHILGSIRIKGLKKIYIDNEDNKQLLQAIEIINKNLEGKGNIHQAQEQLLDAGLKEFAQL